MGQANTDIRDLAYRVQGKRIAFALWLARRVEDVYSEQWAAWLRQPADASRLLVAPDLATALIERELEKATRAFWLEVWQGTIRALPRPLVEVLAARAKRRRAREATDDDRQDQDDIDPSKPSQATPPRTPPIKFAAPLYQPPTKTEVSSLVNASQWKAQLSGLANAKRIQRVVKAGVTTGEATESIARKLRPLFATDKRGAKGNGSRHRAMRVARTEVHRVTQRIQEKGFTDAAGEMLQGYRYVATLDSRTRAHHAARDGKVYALDDRRPILPDGPNCRCTYAPATKSWEDLGVPELADLLDDAERASVDGTVPFHTKYSEWFDAQSADRQREIVGAGRFDKLRGRRSRITWKQFATAPKSPAKRPALRTHRGRTVPPA